MKRSNTITIKGLKVCFFLRCIQTDKKYKALWSEETKERVARKMIGNDLLAIIEEEEHINPLDIVYSYPHDKIKEAQEQGLLEKKVDDEDA